MNMADRLKGVGIALVVCIVSLPVAVTVTIALLPLWRWVEAAFGIESVGHSGPAEWCYLAIYVVVMALVSLVWRAQRRKTTNVGAAEGTQGMSR